MRNRMSLPTTLATAARERRDIVSGEVMDEARLVRFVAGPQGVVVPDLARKLPGRGIWVAATREAVQAAGKKGLFARAAKAKLTAPPDLADQVEALLHFAFALGAWPCAQGRRPYLRVREGAGCGGSGQGGLADRGERRRRRRAPQGSRRGAPRAVSAPGSGHVQFFRIEFGLGRPECDTHSLPCGAGRRALDTRCRATGRFPSALSLKSVARGAPDPDGRDDAAGPRRGIFLTRVLAGFWPKRIVKRAHDGRKREPTG